MFKPVESNSRRIEAIIEEAPSDISGRQAQPRLKRPAHGRCSIKVTVAIGDDGGVNERARQPGELPDIGTNPAKRSLFARKLNITYTPLRTIS